MLLGKMVCFQLILSSTTARVKKYQNRIGWGVGRRRESDLHFKKYSNRNTGFRD